MSGFLLVLFSVLAFTAGLCHGGLSTADDLAPGQLSFKYTTAQRGIFIQEDATINTNPPDYTKVDLGLINRVYDTDAAFDPDGRKSKWERFANYISNLNKHSDGNTRYKLLYLARHGEGYHNVGQSYYGSNCWDCYWSQQTGNGTISWQDAELTPTGVKQALAANRYWEGAMNTSKVPLPETFYTSPMARCLATVNLTFATLPSWTSRPFAPTVKELLRETLNACTCSWRHNRTWIHERYPNYVFEHGFTEDDQLWTGRTVESQSAQEARVKKLLDDIFSADHGTFISLTSHGATIAPILSVIGYPNPRFNLTTGQVIPVFIRAEKLEKDEAASVSVAPPAPAKTCSTCAPGT